MKIFRLLLTCLALAVALVGVLLIAAFIPAVQTWAAQAMLAGRPGLQGSIGSLTAGFGEVDLEDLHLQVEGAVLTLPSLQARLPLTTAALRRSVFVRSLVAKGWTLDLSGGPRPAGAQDGAVPISARSVSAEDVARLAADILSVWKLPADMSLDGVDLEGDVILAAAPGGPPARVHVTVTGGGMAAGSEGTFTVEAEGTATVPGSPEYGVAATGSLAVAMETARTIRRIEIKTDLTANGGPLAGDLTVSADLSAARDPGGVAYGIDVVHGGRHVATVVARFDEAARRFAGTWKSALRDGDVAAFVPDRPLPVFAADGDGQFDADAGFSRVHATGQVSAVASRLDVLVPQLGRLGTVNLGARFDATLAGRSARFDSLSVSLAGARPVARVQSLQPFDLDVGTGDLKPADPQADWARASIDGLPLAWISGLAAGLTFDGGDAAGELVVRSADGGYTLRTTTPITCAGVSLQGAGVAIGKGLDLSLALSGAWGPQGWEVRWAPLLIGRGGQRIATVEAKESRPAGADQPTVIAGSWNADLDALASRPGGAAAGWIAGRSVSGDFTATVGTETKAEGTLSLAGSDPGQSVSASVTADIDADGGVSFLAPVKIANGPSRSEVTVEGTWAGTVDARVSGGNVALGDLGVLAAPLAAAGGAAPPEDAAGPGARDRVPFWGDWAGRVSIAFDRLRTDGQEFSDVAGTFDIDRASIRLEGGRIGIPSHSLTNGEGAITFDPAAESPYGLKASVGAFDVDSAALLASQKRGEDPLFEGHFSVATTVTGSGANLSDLAGRTREEFQLTSSAGIIRFLRSDVADSIPEASAPVRDTLGTAASAVGTVFGVKADPLQTGKNKVSTSADAILDFNNQVSEIGFDRAVITAIREPDGTIRLADLEMTAPAEHLSGSGQISFAKGVPLSQRPLSVDLKLGLLGRPAELLSKADLLSADKDSLGYSVLKQGVHFGGTLESIDATQWDDLLVKATRRPDAGKKGG